MAELVTLTQTTDVIQAAREYLALGFSCIPVGHPSHGDAKRPAFDSLDSWLTYQHRLPEPDELTRWFGGEPRNIGIVAGAVSSGLVIIDCDALATYQALTYRYSELRTSLTVRTGKGMHIYAYAPEPVRTTSFVANGMTHHIKAEGSYCVAPPSLHASGRRYEWVDVDAAPLVLDLARLAAALKAIGAGRRDSAVPEGQRNEPGWVARALNEGARSGERDEKTFKLACYLASKDIPPDIAEAILAPYAALCDQPWSESDTRAKVRSAYATQERNQP